MLYFDFFFWPFKGKNKKKDDNKEWKIQWNEMFNSAVSANTLF